jgi:hypothetical protein
MEKGKSHCSHGLASSQAQVAASTTHGLVAHLAKQRRHAPRRHRRRWPATIRWPPSMRWGRTVARARGRSGE